MLTAERVESPYGAPTWTPSAAQKLIRNRVYLGEARSGEYVNRTRTSRSSAAPSGTPPKVRRRPPPPRTEGLLLSGLVRCAGCRYLMKADKMTDGKGERLSFYRCRRRHPGGVCPAPASTLARVLDPLVEEMFLREIADSEGLFAEASRLLAVIEQAQARLDAAVHELGEYMTVSVTGVGRAAYQAGLDARVGAVEEARRELAEARQRSALAATVKLTPGELMKAWPELTIPERREILTATLDCVVVSQGRNLPIGERVPRLLPRRRPGRSPPAGTPAAARPVRRSSRRRPDGGGAGPAARPVRGWRGLEATAPPLVLLAGRCRRCEGRGGGLVATELALEVAPEINVGGGPAEHVCECRER